MSERVICATDQNISIFENGKCRRLTSEFIEQYCANQQQIVRKSAWKTDGYGARFRMEGSSASDAQIQQIQETAMVTGIAPIGHGDIIFSVMVGDSSGLFKRSTKLGEESHEGHIIHDRGMLFRDVCTSSDGRMAFSIVNKNGEHNIAIAKIGSSQYQELTSGDSIDRNPFWDPRNPNVIVFDSAPIAYDNRGTRYICPRSIMKVDLKNSEIETIIESDEYDFINPQMDKDGNIWCIQRPFKTPPRSTFSPLDVVLMPFRIGRAIFRAIEMFTIRNTGEPLITSGSNPSKARFAPKNLVFEGMQIDSDRNFKENLKSGDSLAGFIPKTWELIQIDPERQIFSHARSVCSFTMLSSKAYIYSNGKYLFRCDDGNVSKIAEAILPTKIVVA